MKEIIGDGKFPDTLFVKVDVDQGPEVAGQYSVRGIPTMVFIRDERCDHTLDLVGALPRTQIEKHLKKFLKVKGGA